MFTSPYLDQKNKKKKTDIINGGREKTAKYYIANKEVLKENAVFLSMDTGQKKKNK